jgi:hypothetical protein
VASLVRVEARNPFIVIRARPTPGVRWAAQSQPESIQPLHNLAAANHVVAFKHALTRSFAQDLLADFCVEGKKLCSCHLGTLNALGADAMRPHPR